MIQFQREEQQTIPTSAVKIVAIGGAGANMLDRFALDGMEGADLLALNTDARTLASCVTASRIQMGEKLTHGLGSGGDPELGAQATKASEQEIRDALRNYKMIFICAGLGGGTGSGAAPIVARIARELGAFVTVFVTMPFAFEGSRRRQQAEASLNELSVIANALITFDNGRMGELILADQGVHEAFSAADRMIAESIKAVTRLVVRPGIINIGLDDLITALRARKSRCLFGSGIASGSNRAHVALKSALDSPLLDKGHLLHATQSVLVHICGGESLSLYEIELLMRELAKVVPSEAHILFGASVDPSMGEEVSLTLISALPEESLSQTSPSLFSQSTPIPLELEPEVTVEPEVTIEPEVEEVRSPQEPEALSPTVAATPEDSDDSEAASPLAASPIEPQAEVQTITPSSKLVSAPELEEISPFAPKPEKPEPEEITTRLPAPSRSDKEVKDPKSKSTQNELALDGGPKGKFSGTEPNLFQGEDLDVPPFLRTKHD